MSFLEEVYWRNTVGDWLTALLVAAGTVVVLKLLQRFTRGRIEAISRRTQTSIDDVIIETLSGTRTLFIVAIALLAGAWTLTLTDHAQKIWTLVLIVAVIVQSGLWANRLIGGWTRHYVERRLAEDPAAGTTLRAVAFLGRLVVWSLLLLVALDSFGLDITALVAGLGVGGIAVALAVQNILSDLFASLSIVLDKPFVVGDFIIVGDFLGTVERIGIKTTRIRSLSGEQLIFANNDLLQSRIRNYKRMEERRVAFSLGVVYQTPRDKLEAIPGWIREIIEATDNVRFDRSHFKQYGSFSLDFETVYWVLSPDYNQFMDIQQQILLAIHKRFATHGVEFAYPTQTLLVEKSTS